MNKIINSINDLFKVADENNVNTENYVLALSSKVARELVILFEDQNRKIKEREDEQMVELKEHLDAMLGARNTIKDLKKEFFDISEQLKIYHEALIQVYREYSTVLMDSGCVSMPDIEWYISKAKEKIQNAFSETAKD